MIWAGGQKAEDFRFCVWVRGRMNRTKIAANIQTTPPSLFGMDRRIAYAHRKYHSGLICRGVVSGFAIVQFSGSLSRFG